MAIDTDILSFGEYNNNCNDENTKVGQLVPLVLNTALTAADTNKIPVRRSGVWSIEGEEAYNGIYQDFGNITGEVVLTIDSTSSRTAMTGTITGNTFVTGFGANFLSGILYVLFLKQNATGGFSVRWPYGASVLKQVGTLPDQLTEVYILKLPNGKIFIKCEAFQNTVDIGYVIKEFEFPEITYPDGSQAPMSFTWTKAPAVGYGGTVSGLYSDWEIADDVLYTNLLFSSYNNTSDLYSIQVVLTQAGTVYMRTRFGGVIGGDAVVSPWDEAVCELAGMGGGDRYWDQTVLCINANKYGWEGSRKIVDEKGGSLTLNGDTKVSNNATFSKWCGVVDGSGDTIDTNIGLNRIVSGSEWTIEGFFYTVGNSGNPNFYGQALFVTNTTVGANLLNVYFHEQAGVLSGKVRVAVGNGSSYTDIAITISPAITVNTLYHIALVRNGSDLFLFVDGIKYLVTSSFPAYQHTGNFRFFRGSSDTQQEYLKGGFTSIRITKVARYTSDFQVDLTDPYFKTGNLWWTPEPKEIATDNFAGKDDWDKVYHCFNFYGVSGSTTIKDLSSTPSLVAVAGNAQIGNSSDWSFLLLDGSGDYLTFPTNFNPNISGWGIDVIIYPTSFSKVHTILHMVTSGVAGFHIHIDTSGYLLVNNGLVGTTAANTQLSVNTFYHISVKNIAGVIYGYINGVQCLTHAAQTYNVPTICYIGRANTQSFDFTGRIYSLKISDGETSSANFTPKTVANPYFITKPKVENWAETSLLINALDLPVGSTDIRDFKGNAISLYGDTKVAVDSNGLEYINFDGSGDYLQTAALASLALGAEFTIELFFSVSSYSTYYTIFDSRGAGEGTAIYFESPGRIAISNNSTVLGRTADGVVPFDSIAHLAMCRKSSSLNIYINGIFVVSISDARTMHSAPYYFLGRSTTGQYGNFKMYGVRVNNLKALYTSNFAVDLTNPYFPAYENALADLWIDGNDYSKITLATGVSKIVDKSGNMREAVQAATASQPALVQNAQNGLMALSMDGTNDYMEISGSNNTSEPLKFGTDSFNFFGVFSLTVDANHRVIFGARGYSVGWMLGTLNQKANVRAYNAGELWNPTPNNVNLVSGSQIWDFSFPRSETGKFYLDGNLGQSTTSAVGASTLSTNTMPVRLGCYSNDSNVVEGFMLGSIQDLMAIRHKITDWFRFKLQGFFAHKWALTANLPATHPYKTGFPVEDTRTDDYWYATVLCINGTDIIRPTEIVDSSRNNKITVYGDTKVLIDSNNKPYINFDGSGDYLTSARSGDIPLETWPVATLEFFVSISSSGRKGLCGTRSPENGFVFGVSSSNKFWSFFPGEAGFSGTTTVVPGQLYHVALIFSGGFRKIYVDGSLEATSSIPATTVGGKFYIGCEDSTIYGPITAKIYALRVTKGIARYTEDFNVDLTNPYFPKLADREEHWDKMAVFLSAANQPSTTPTTDIVGNPVTYYGGAVIDSVAGFPAFYFDGTNNYLSIPAPAGGWGLNNQYTIDWYSYSDSATKVGAMNIGNYNTGAGGWPAGMLFSFRDWTGLRFYCYCTGMSEQFHDWTKTISANTLYHYAFVRNGSEAKFYINGVLTWTKTGITLNGESTQPFTLGRWEYVQVPEYYKIRIPCLRITKVVRWTSDFTPPSFPFTA